MARYGRAAGALPPASVALLALHEKQGHPQVVSTDRHVLQGALELQELNWDAEPDPSRRLAGPLGRRTTCSCICPNPTAGSRADRSSSTISRVTR